ncbi:pre-peptidase C-terminal domain-containing protein [Luteimonas sp. 50]|uniref:Pre-peptidase C-terminal domain-containing protein n=1 Tax=Cognatiluteimonas sedimenti TaxID=2927791 RepID=A0ABT0A4K6_9GAMM|nr:PilC/PilY family type IV pilus protein [Lysobacter sedimenti]MCJ0825917.1 pre-peptidase C-terminal domain-containing protein [Lysobacter sedimenti]
MPRRSRVLPFAATCLATLLALPVNAAVVFPDNPLQTGAAYPPPNVMFILDDSGSMAFDFMPGANSSSEVPKTSPQQIQLQAYPRNTLYYNPNTTYQPWLKADGSRYTGGTDYTEVYTSDTLLSGSYDLSDNTQTFYVPKSDATDLSDSRQYERYDIKKVSGTLRVIKSATLASGAWDNQDVGKNNWKYFSLSVPAGATRLDVDANDDKDNGDLYVRYNQQPDKANSDCSDTSGKSKSCGVDNPAAGTWYIGIYGNSKVDNIDISYIVNSVSYSTPTGRSESDEIKNFATWYSYYRTRSKMAKGAASEAFGQIGSNIRVGFDTIWNRSPYNIPVGTDNGQFVNTNRSTWFSRLQNATANNGTPLKGALQRTGKYYEGSSSSGPWGPESGSDQLTCRQSFAILTTDGYWNSDNDYDGTINDADDTDGAVITSSDGKSTGQYKAEPPYSDKNGHASSGKYFDTLADIANHYWKRDLRTTLDNNVPASSGDPAFWQHMTTFGLAIGQSGTLNPDVDLVSIKNGSKYWPKPVADEASTIDDLWHASINGHGSFVAASNPTKFAQGLVNALATVAARNGSASNVTANSTSFQSDTAVYQASYVSGKWNGELASYAVSSAGVATDANGDPIATWKASEHIPAYPGRAARIMTWNGTAGATFPTGAQSTALARAGGLAPVTGVDNANYIKGDQSNEKQNGKLLRDRIQTVLGDIVDSSPLFLKETATGTQTIFVGANDGMLHAFNAQTGAEQFAYIPGGLDLANLASLSDPQYVHKWFVDGPVVVSTQSKTPGVNYLVGALGRGGRGLYGLDVSDPANFGTGSVLWDKTGSAAPANMGQVLGEPLIAKFNDGTTGIIASNGINSSTGAASLFIINIATGAPIKELDTGATGGNGLSAPRGWDNDGNGTVDYVYAGDLKGNLWKFDLTAGSSSGWTVANSGAPMFVAKDKSNNRQPITSGLALAKDPATGKRWVFIGTGSFMSNGDVTDKSVQSMYGVIDDGSVVTGRTSGGDGDLQKREIILIDGTQKYRGFEANGTLDAAKKGWYIDLLTPPSPGTAEGERIVNRPIVSGTVLVTASMIPPTGETCEAGGRGYINALDAFSGTSTKDSYFDTNHNGDFSDDVIGPDGAQVPIGSVDLGVGMPTLPTIIDNLLVVGGSTGEMGQIKINPQSAGARRITWREILRD